MLLRLKVEWFWGYSVVEVAIGTPEYSRSPHASYCSIQLSRKNMRVFLQGSKFKLSWAIFRSLGSKSARQGRIVTCLPKSPTIIVLLFSVDIHEAALSRVAIVDSPLCPNSSQ